MFAHWSLALALCTMLAVGCNRVAPKVIPKAGGLLDDAAKAAPVGGQAAPKTGQTVGQRVEKWADRADTAMTAYDRYQQVTATPAPAGRPRERFPFPASSVKPVSNQSIVLNQAGAFAVPNNYGGYSFFNASGRPLGFSAWSHTLNEERYFDPTGYGL